MVKEDPTIYEHKVDGNYILVSKNSCKEAQKYLRDFKFKIESTRITLKPHGYIYDMGSNDECFIGISPIDDKYNHYRLGTVFLRNFYVALDYESNYIGFA